jgi:hypothetical protein
MFAMSVGRWGSEQCVRGASRQGGRGVVGNLPKRSRYQLYMYARLVNVPQMATDREGRRSRSWCGVWCRGSGRVFWC